MEGFIREFEFDSMNEEGNEEDIGKGNEEIGVEENFEQNEEDYTLQSIFYVLQYALHYIQMWLLWCLHELIHHSNCITQIWPCDGHVDQTPHYASVHSGILHKVSFICT